MCTMCAQLNNKAPVRIGRGTASCDMPIGHIQLLSFPELVRMSSGLVGLETPH